MDKKSYLFISIIITTICIVVFFFIFKFERKVQVYSNFSPNIGQLKKIKTTKIGQNFEKPENEKFPGFNRLELAIVNPGEEVINCLFKIREQKGGQIIYNSQIILNDCISTHNLTSISFPMQMFKKSNQVYFELESLKPFYFCSINDYTPSKYPSFHTYVSGKEVTTPLVFGVNYQERVSIGTFFFSHSKSPKGLLGVFLILISLMALFFGCYFFIKVVVSAQHKPLSPSVNILKHENAIIITSLAIFLLCYLFCSFLIGNNTYSSLVCTQDDSFISYRYAKNISEGNGFRYNPDEKVLGTTTPLYTLILSFFGLFSSNFPMISVIISFISLFLSSLLLNIILTRKLSSTTGLAGGILFLFFPMFYRVIDMETNFLIFLIITSLFMFSEKKYFLAFFFCGLATLTRIESVILIPLFAVHMILRKEYKIVLKSTFIFLISLLPWFIFSWFYFGNILPNTFYVKTAIGYTGDSFFSKIFFLLKEILNLNFLKSVFFTGFYNYAPVMIQHYFIWVIFFFLGILLSLKNIIKLEFLRLYLLWAILYIFSFSVLNVPLFIWYFVLALAIFPLFLVTGLHEFLKFLDGRIQTKAVMVYLFSLILMGLLVFESHGIFNFFNSQWYSKNIPHQERFDTYVEVSKYIKENIQKEKTIAMEEIGIVGYYIDNKICDFYCLVHAAEKFPHYFPAESKNRIPYLLTLMNPDYILINSYRLNSNAIFGNYKILRVFEVDEYNYNPNFYYALLEKAPDQLVILGGISLKKRVTGTALIEGWVFGTEPIESVELIVNDKILSTTHQFFKNSDSFRDYFRFNPHSGKSAFKIKFSSNNLNNGKYELVLRARRGDKSGIFVKKRVVINN